MSLGIGQRNISHSQLSLHSLSNGILVNSSSQGFQEGGRSLSIYKAFQRLGIQLLPYTGLSPGGNRTVKSQRQTCPNAAERSGPFHRCQAARQSSNGFDRMMCVFPGGDPIAARIRSRKPFVALRDGLDGLTVSAFAASLPWLSWVFFLVWATS
ncbi:hypothetical protein EDB83DRAFT_2321774 [Lactarius deliciosus]|nr:hypothetical protein EDB83DRAFT_2321774 [Lactarius deliciosus]